MPRPRKVAVVEKENMPAPAPKAGKQTVKKQVAANNKKQKIDYEGELSNDEKSVAVLTLALQKNFSIEAKTKIDLKKLYTKLGQAKFVGMFNKVIMACLIRPDSDSENVTKLLKFIGSFVASFGEETTEDGGSHPLIASTFDLILSITSKFHHVRARICMIVAHIMMNFTQKAEIDEDIIENIIIRMQGTFVRDSNPIVRQNALLALQRLQDPDNMEDSVVRVYLFHLEHDPVAKVRTTVISSIAKKLNLMPYIIDRLQDIDEKVRRHVYQQMASFPVKSYRIIDRISFLKAGLNDRSEKVRDTIVNIFLPNWIAAYDRDYTEFIKSFKMDSSEKELASFRELSQKALDIVLKKQKMSELLEYLKITDDSEYPKCIPVEKTSLIEWLIVWKMTIQIYQNTGKSNEEVNNEDESDHEETEKKEVENIVPELSVMCSFIERFAKDFKIDNPNEAKYQNLVFNHSLIVLFEIVQLCDLSDEVGCTRIRELIKYILIEHDVTEFAIKEITEVMQKIDQSPESCINFFNDIVLEMVGTGVSEYNRKTLIEGLIDKADVTLKVKINSLKMELMDLKEKEEVFVERKEYGKAQKVKENYEQLESQLYELLKPLQDSQQDLDSLSADIKKFQGNKKLSANEIVKNLRITFSSLMMRGIKTMNHKTLEIYNNFVRYHLGSSDNLTLVCALKAATSCGMLYESLAKEIFMILKSKIFQSAVSSVWETAINGIIDLILRYGMDKVDTVVTPEMSSTNNRSKKGGRTLYSSFLEEEDEMSEEIGMEKSIDVIMLLNHVLDNEMDSNIQKACIIGLCKLILHGIYSTRELVAKFLIAYFNPVTDSEISQILGLFFENMVKYKKQESLSEALILTLKTLIDSPHDSPLREVKIETVLRYVIEVTRPVFCSNGLNLHNDLSIKLLEFISENNEEKELFKVIPKELLTLEIGDDPILKRDLIAKIDFIFPKEVIDIKSNKHIKELRSILNGTYRPPLQFSSTAGHIQDQEQNDDEENEQDKDEENEEVNKNEDENNAEDDKDLNESEIVSDSKIDVKECVVNVSLLSKSVVENAEEIDLNESKKSEECELSQTIEESREVEEDLDSSVVVSVNITAAEFATPTPKDQNPAARRTINKRQIFTPKTFESPLRKRVSGADNTMATPNFTLSKMKASTPNTERQTRSRSKLEKVQTRSKSANTSRSGSRSETAASKERGTRKAKK